MGHRINGEDAVNGKGCPCFLPRFARCAVFNRFVQFQISRRNRPKPASGFDGPFAQQVLFVPGRNDTRYNLRVLISDETTLAALIAFAVFTGGMIFRKSGLSGVFVMAISLALHGLSVTGRDACALFVPANLISRQAISVDTSSKIDLSQTFRINQNQIPDQGIVTKRDQ